VLVAATAFGLWRRATEGRLREVGPGPGARAVATAPMTGIPVPLPDDAPPVDLHDPDAEAAVARERGLPIDDRAPEDLHGGDLGPAELGVGLGERATLVQFSSAFCQPCVATRRILGEVADMVDGVVHVDIDAEDHLDLVRRLDIRRTPTVLVLNPQGHIVRRASGAPRKADVIAALGAID
jgi:thiol-disulfide isomerase/thioredoxin